MRILVFIAGCVVKLSLAATKNKPHSHNGVLEPYDGKLIAYSITPDQQSKLDKGSPIILTTRDSKGGKGGRGFVLQDVEAPVSFCMDRISDLAKYPKMVPHVNSVEIYHQETLTNGTIKTGAKFTVGVMAMRFGYFLTLTQEPKYNTLTWTLDYQYNSDFDDTVGHWQVMEHPTKPGWSRVLYSTKIKLPGWIPEFIVNFLTNSALVESTGWVKKESEDAFKKSGAAKVTKFSGGETCYREDERPVLKIPFLRTLRGRQCQ